MQIELPLNATSALTLVGATALAMLFSQWLKKYLGDWRFTGLLTLALAEGASLGALLVVAKGRPDGEAWFAAALIGFLGASVAVFGYEQLANFLGFVGIGPRSNKALRAQAARMMTPRF